MEEEDGVVNLRCGVCSGWMTTEDRIGNYEAWHRKYQEEQRQRRIEAALTSHSNHHDVVDAAAEVRRSADDGGEEVEEQEQEEEVEEGDAAVEEEEQKEEEDQEEEEEYDDEEDLWGKPDTSFFHGLSRDDYYSASRAVAFKMMMVDQGQKIIQLYAGFAGTSEEPEFYCHHDDNDFPTYYIMDPYYCPSPDSRESGVLCTHASCLELYVGTTLFDKYQAKEQEGRRSPPNEKMRERRGLAEEEEEKKRREEKKQAILWPLFLYLSECWAPSGMDYDYEAVEGVESYHYRLQHSYEDDYSGFYVEAHPGAYHQWSPVPRMNALELRHLHATSTEGGGRQKKTQKKDGQQMVGEAQRMPKLPILPYERSLFSPLEELMINKSDISVTILSYLNFFEQEAFSLCSPSAFRVVLDPALQNWYKMRIDNDLIAFVPPSWTLSDVGAKVTEEVAQVDPEFFQLRARDHSSVDPLLSLPFAVSKSAARGGQTGQQANDHNAADPPPPNWRRFLYTCACSPSWRNRLRIILCTRQLNEAIAHGKSAVGDEEGNSVGSSPGDENGGVAFRSQFVRENDFLSSYLDLTGETMPSWDVRSLKFVEGLVSAAPR